MNIIKNVRVLSHAGRYFTNSSAKETGFFRQFRYVFNFKVPAARSRSFVILFNAIESLINYITGGVFYTTFLTGYGINITQVGILAFIPSIASLCYLFVPSILNRFPRRKYILAFFKLLYYLLVLGMLTALPVLVTDEAGRLWGMIGILLVSNMCNCISNAGYSAWHIAFIPDDVRPLFFTSQQFIGALLSGVFLLISSRIIDSLSEHGINPLTLIVAMRYGMILLGLISLTCLLLMPEVDYPALHTPRFSDIFTVPFQNRKFMLTMVICFFWSFANNCYTAQLNVYLTNTIGVSYTFYNFIIFAYSLFFIIFSGFWRKRLHAGNWFRVYQWCMLIVAPLQILYGFVRPDCYVALMLIVRLPQHFAGVGQNTAYANFQYINMPAHNRECFSSFYQIIFSMGSFVGILFGTLFVNLTQNLSYTLFGYTYTSGVGLLTSFAGVVQIGIFCYLLAFRKKIEPFDNI